MKTITDRKVAQILERGSCSFERYGRTTVLLGSTHKGRTFLMAFEECSQFAAISYLTHLDVPLGKPRDLPFPTTSVPIGDIATKPIYSTIDEPMSNIQIPAVVRQSNKSSISNDIKFVKTKSSRACSRLDTHVMGQQAK